MLEAIYLVATSRSFRTNKLAELIRHDAASATVHATFASAHGHRTQAVAVAPRATTLRVDDAPPASAAAYATQSPVVAFHARELELSSGPPAARRTLLDRLSLFLTAASADHRRRYAHAIKSRQQLLRTGPASGSALDAFEDLCARHGAAITETRAIVAAELAADFATLFRRLAPVTVVPAMRYRPAGSASPEEARAALARSRSSDRERMSPRYGPHHDELEILLDHHSVRHVGSQGQHRLVTLALKAAEAATIARTRSIAPVMLLDDLSSELDGERMAALLDLLHESDSQIFLTTTRPELVTRASPNRLDFVLDRGALRALPRAPV